MSASSGSSSGQGTGGGTRSVIHDLRQPLAALQVWLDLLDGALKGRLDEKEQRYLAKIREEASRLGALLSSASSAGGTSSAAATPAEPAATTRASTPGDPKPGAAPENPPGLRLAGAPLLLVEDDDVTAEALQLALEAEGASVAIAGSIADALALLDAAPPVAVLSDLRLPDGDGYDLVREIRKRDQAAGRHTAVVAVTGFDSSETRAATRSAGFDELIGKPFSITHLLATLDRLIAA
ncbi:MAG TPA: response regulator [Candidatus Binatia bacterium]